MPAIFIVDDDYDILFSLDTWFKLKNYVVQTFSNGNGLVNNILQNRPDLVLMDVMLNGEDGRSLCRDIKEQAKYPVKVLLFSADPMSLLTYQDSYADGIINKPFELDALEDKCRKLLSVSRRWYE